MSSLDEPSKKMIEFSFDSNEAKCSICLDIWHDPVSVGPCIHEFCNECISKWMSDKRRIGSCFCPLCRVTVRFVGINHFLCKIEELLKRNSSIEVEALTCDSSVEVADDNVAASALSLIDPISSLVVDHVMPEDDFDFYDIHSACPQCVTTYSGYRCPTQTHHLQCHQCGGMMPYRNNISVPQHCLGCDKPACGAYWRFVGRDEYQYMSTQNHIPRTEYMCHPWNFLKVADWTQTLTKIPVITHESNRHEQQITEDCLEAMNTNIHAEVSRCIKYMDHNLLDLDRMPLNSPSTINSKTFICKNCFDKLVSYFLYLYRTELPYELDALQQREDCPCGYVCKQQHSSEEHAVLLNHVCSPTNEGK